MTAARPFARPGLRPGAQPADGIVVRRWTLLAGMALGGLALLWAGGTTWFILARDDIAQRVFARETEAAYGYQDRIGDLKTRLEREITANLVERNGFSARVDALASRQSEIEARQRRILGLAERVAGREDATAGPLPLPGPASSGPAGGAPARAPLPDGFGLRLGPPSPGPEVPRDRLSALEGSLGTIEAKDLGLLDTIRRVAVARAVKMRVALEATGLDGHRLAAPRAGMGGPLVPLPAGAGPFGPVAADAEANVAELARLETLGEELPLAPPLSGALETTSPFGYRIDPFTRGAALHTGVDLRAEVGSPVRATAPGRVVTAEYTGGYGNMVEIDHGHGLSTRYGHLSGFAVAPGETVVTGQIIGRAGSTGRSTGSHLHYETRIDGEPVNPERFLQAGRAFRAAGL